MLMVLSGDYLAYIPDHYAFIWAKSGRIRPITPSVFSMTEDIFLIGHPGSSDSRPMQLFLTDIRAAALNKASKSTPRTGA